MTKKLDGVIHIDTDPRDDVGYAERIIEGLPPEAQSWAARLLVRSVLLEWKEVGKSIERMGDALRKLHHPGWPKKGGEEWLKWKEAALAMPTLDKMDAQELDPKKPTAEEYADFLFGRGIKGYKGLPYTTKTIGRIRKAAAEGWLE